MEELLIRELGTLTLARLKLTAAIKNQQDIIDQQQEEAKRREKAIQDLQLELDKYSTGADSANEPDAEIPGEAP